MMALTKSLAAEDRLYHIKVSAICPGAVADELVDASPADIEYAAKRWTVRCGGSSSVPLDTRKYAVVHHIVIDRSGAER